jgi:type I restriction enzyme S subunit
MPRVSWDFMSNLQLALPPKQEQQQIVDFLDKKTDEITQTIQTIKDEIKLLKEYKEILIYEVVTGKIDVRSGDEVN